MGGMFAFYLRDYQNCNMMVNPFNKPNQKTSNNLLYKSFSNAIMTYSISTVVEFIVGFIPFVGAVFKVISYIPILGTLMSGLFYVLIYILVNMYNSSDNPAAYCLESGFGGARDILTIISGVIYVLILFKNMILGALGF
jgi:hypothetical protein